MESLVLNGQSVTREEVADWLRSKRITLWADWCITDPRRMDKAVDWFMEEMTALSASMEPKPKEATVKGKKKNGTSRQSARSSR